jgi:hypothetical protein
MESHCLSDEQPNAVVQASESMAWKRIRLTVPTRDSTLFARPDLADATELVRSNINRLSQADFELQGRSFQTLRHQSRQAIASAAQEYTSQLRGESVDDFSFQSLIVAGHQPALFHAGVWAKNFAIARLANETGGRALNLVVDNDTQSNTRVRVPAGSRERLHFESVDFDADRESMPWEESPVVDASRFDSFAARITDAMRVWKIEPIVNQGWDAARRVAGQTSHLRDALTAARHSLERQWGLDNLELPISHMCREESFQWFAAHLLVNLPRFQTIHNEVLDEYRVVNRVRSQTHPVPALSQTDQWLEAPFRVWNAGDTRRRRVFARQAAKTLHLSDGRNEFCVLPITPEMDACCAVEALQALENNGVRFRTRALTTTLFSRLMFADLFVHGIGGAKYDELTDRIIHRFYGLVPPGFQVISATMHLPFAEPFEVAPDTKQRLTRRQRDLRYNPQRALTKAELMAVGALLSEKQQLIEAEQKKFDGQHDHAANYDRYARLRQINLELQKHTVEQQLATSRSLNEFQQLQVSNSAIRSREYSFCLFPEERLRPFLTSVGGLS